ncbi:hypothetical protein EDB80DRAFT_708310 [Ilyonectria destructans]|nr:hypothetical protein EDB80DRAFT_708310 [Ilyonectria destructans]
MVPYDSPIFICTQEDLEGIKKLLRSGKASINDVDPYGLGLLYYAAYYCWRAFGKDVAIRTCRLLLDLGVDSFACCCLMKQSSGCQGAQKT